jgi:hypothetical protein
VGSREALDQTGQHLKAFCSPSDRLRADCTTVVRDIMKDMSKHSLPRRPGSSSVRQSVTIPAQLAIEVRRVAKQKHLTMSRALVVLAERGVEAEAAARENLNAAYRKFVSEVDVQRKNEAGEELIRSIFGKDAIAEDPVL